jgi:hypothetical protein
MERVDIFNLTNAVINAGNVRIPARGRVQFEVQYQVLETLDSKLRSFSDKGLILWYVNDILQPEVTVVNNPDSGGGGGGGPTTGANALIFRKDFTFANSGSIQFDALLAGDTITTAEITITQPFSDNTSGMGLGTTLDPSMLIPFGQAAPYIANTYGSDLNVSVASGQHLVITLSPGASVSGAGYALVQIKR